MARVRPRLAVVGPEGLAPFAPGLEALEADLTYPLDGGRDHFRIRHGARYEAFFLGLGEPRFVVATEGERVVGTLALVAREALDGERPVRALYFADLKVARDHRGTGLARRLAFRAARAALAERRFRSCEVVSFAAMRGEKGDVRRTARGASPLRLFRPLAELDLYFESPARLAALPDGGPPPPAPGGLDLSPRAAPASGPPLVSTEGRKDFVLESTGRPWPLVHVVLPPLAWLPSFGASLRAAGEALAARPREPGAAEPIACFALDARLEAHRGWLAARGLTPGARAAVPALLLRNPFRRRPAWVHMATSEI